MMQTVFPFIKDNYVQQLELFDANAYDNRVQRLTYAVRLSHGINGWRPIKLKDVEECSKAFRVTHEMVWKVYDRYIQEKYP